MKKYSLVICIAWILNGCSALDSVAKNAADNNEIASFVLSQELNAVDQIVPFTLREFMALDDQHIAVVGVNNKTFLLTTPESCKDIKFAKKVNLYTSVDNMVQAKLDKISRIGEEYSACTITGIYPLNQVQFDELAHLNRDVRNGKNNFPRPLSGF